MGAPFLRSIETDAAVSAPEGQEAMVSIAISLKRIADALENQAVKLSPEFKTLKLEPTPKSEAEERLLYLRAKLAAATPIGPVRGVKVRGRTYEVSTIKHNGKVYTRVETAMGGEMKIMHWADQIDTIRAAEMFADRLGFVPAEEYKD